MMWESLRHQRRVTVCRQEAKVAIVVLLVAGRSAVHIKHNKGPNALYWGTLGFASL
jgi:hypothetical protein